MVFLIMPKTRGVHGQYDMRGRCGTRTGSSRPKVGPAGPTPLAGRPGTGAFSKAIFTTCQSKSVRRVSNVGKVVERLNLAAHPPIKKSLAPKFILCRVERESRF
jgi:hypothetical protein